MPNLSAPLLPVWEATAPEPVAVPLEELEAVELALGDDDEAEAAEDVLEAELAEDAEDAEDATEAEEEEAAEVADADEEDAEEAAEVAAAPVPVEVS